MRHFTLFGAALQRFGAPARVSVERHRALDGGAQVLVYPGGDLEAYRTTARRNEIILGERTGFVRVAQQAGVPIVPIVAHGAHRSAYILTDGERIARASGSKRWARLERFPVALALPWGSRSARGRRTCRCLSRSLRVLPPIAAPAGADPAAVREQVRARHAGRARRHGGDPSEMTAASAARSDHVAPSVTSLTFRTRDGGTIAYEVDGEAHASPPLLLVRPLGGSMELWGGFQRASRESSGSSRTTRAGPGHRARRRGA